jgi:hypothetical protein
MANKNWKPPPQVGDPQTGTDRAWRGPASKGSKTSVPTEPFQPNPPHSQPPAGEGPKAPAASGPITPKTRLAPLVPRR